MIALLDVTKNNYDLYDYCGSTSHCWSLSCHGVNGLFGIIRRSLLFLLNLICVIFAVIKKIAKS